MADRTVDRRSCSRSASHVPSAPETPRLRASPARQCFGRRCGASRSAQQSKVSWHCSKASSRSPGQACTETAHPRCSRPALPSSITCMQAACASTFRSKGLQRPAALHDLPSKSRLTLKPKERQLPSEFKSKPGSTLLSSHAVRCPLAAWLLMARLPAS